MDNVKIKVVKNHPDAVLPSANNKESGTGDTGYDLTAVESVWIPPGTSRVVEVGLTLADVTPGYWVKIEPRSGLGFKNSIQPHLGVIDNGYRGDLGVKLYNFHETKDLQVKPGDKIAQLIVYPLIQPTFEFTDEVTDTTRGDKGFGSSDKKNPFKHLTRPPFAGAKEIIESVNNEGEVSISATDNTKTVQFKTTHDESPFGDDVNPWEFTNVQDLIDWAKKHRDVVDDDFFSELLNVTISNRDKVKNV